MAGHDAAAPDREAELVREGLALVRARIAEDHDAVRFLLDNASSLRGLAEVVLGFSYEVWLLAMAVSHPDASREELAGRAEEILAEQLLERAAAEAGDGS